MQTNIYNRKAKTLIGILIAVIALAIVTVGVQLIDKLFNGINPSVDMFVTVPMAIAILAVLTTTITRRITPFVQFLKQSNSKSYAIGITILLSIVLTIAGISFANAPRLFGHIAHPQFLWIPVALEVIVILQLILEVTLTGSNPNAKVTSQETKWSASVNQYVLKTKNTKFEIKPDGTLLSPIQLSYIVFATASILSANAILFSHDAETETGIKILVVLFTFFWAIIGTLPLYTDVPVAYEYELGYRKDLWNERNRYANAVEIVNAAYRENKQRVNKKIKNGATIGAIMRKLGIKDNDPNADYIYNLLQDFNTAYPLWFSSVAEHGVPENEQFIEITNPLQD